MKKANDIAITGSLAANIACFADEAGMEVEQYLEWALATLNRPMAPLDILELMPEGQRIYLYRKPEPGFHRLSSHTVPDGWMEMPIKEIRPGWYNAIIIELEEDHAQEDS